MTASNEHRKVRYTKMVIRESFFELLETKPLKQITVKELCELADINRGTFYSHYTDIYDLVEKLEDELIEKVNSEIEFNRIGKKDQLLMFTAVFTHIQKNIGDYKLILLNPDSSRCMDGILAETYKYHASVLTSIHPPISQNMIDYTFALLSSGGTQVILNWIENDFEESPEEMAKLIHAYTDFGFSSLFGDN